MAFAFGERNGVRIDLMPSACSRCAKPSAVTAVAVVDQISWRPAVPATGFDDLASGPLCGRVTGDAQMNHFAVEMVNDEEDIDRPEQQRLDAEEVTGPDLACLQRQECSPAR